MLSITVEVLPNGEPRGCTVCGGVLPHKDGYLVRLHIGSHDPGMKDTVQTLQGAEKARCPTCGAFSHTPQVFTSLTEAQHVADKVRSSLNQFRTVPRQFKFR